jgi:hypothetical protein
VVALIKPENLNMPLEYEKAESEFIELINCDDLDGKVLTDPDIVENFNDKIHSALKKSLDDDDESAHLFVQRCLYKLTDLNFSGMMISRIIRMKILVFFSIFDLILKINGQLGKKNRLLLIARMMQVRHYATE